MEESGYGVKSDVIEDKGVSCSVRASVEAASG